jgi:hypothetical protein
MERRQFLRLVGGGTVAAATAGGLAGCGAAMPPEAIAAWAGPGEQPDLRRWVLSWALLAPHSHNLQSWIADLRTPERITLYCDRTRLLPETDPLSRQILMSQGTFLELLSIAAQAAALPQHRAIASEAWRIELTTPRTIMESYRVLRVGSAEIAQHRDGISLTQPMVVALTKLGLFDRTQAPKPGDSAVAGQIEDFDKKIATTPAFLWMTSEANDRPAQVNAGRAYARVQLAATAAGLAMQPLSQALQEYPEVKGPWDRIHRLLAPSGGTVQMWARVGFGPAIGPAPRRGLDAIIRT